MNQIKINLFKFLPTRIFFIFFITHSLLHIDNCYCQWVIQNSGTTQHLYDVYFINTQTGWACGNNGTIVKTTNGGNNWFGQTSGTTFSVESIHFVNSNIGYCIIRGTSINKTTNSGNNWFTVHFSPKLSQSIYFIDSLRGWATGTYSVGWVFRTTDGGTSWDSVVVGGLGIHVYFLNSLIGWVASGSEIYKSTDGGVSWSFQYSTIGNGEIAEFSFVNQNTGLLVTLETYQIHKTTNGGSNWEVMDTLPDCFNAHSIYFSSLNTGWVSGDCGYMFKTTDGGVSWGQQNTAGSGFLSSVVFLTDSIGWSVGGSGVIIHTTNGVEYLNAIGEINTVPYEYKLYQNYPNPFNSTTKIKFAIPKSSHIKIIIYDNLGRELAVLVNEELKAGIYEVNWETHSEASGVYFYRLNTINFSYTRTMVLIK